MPELPEVETTVRGLRKTIIGLKIKNVWTDLATKDKRKHDTAANTKYFKFFKREITGKKVLSVERRAKNILINLSGEKSRLRQGFDEPKKTILIHMKMTGHLLYGKYKFGVFKDGPWGNSLKGRPFWIPIAPGPLHDPFNRFIHVVFTFSNGKHLAFSDARKFGKITLLDTKTAHDTKHLSNIGPEPLDPKFKLKNLILRLNRSKNKKIKTVLMDQSVIAGIGNIYSDEILWCSGVHPERQVAEIRGNEMKLIFQAIKEVLAKGIDFGGDSMSDYRNVHGLPGKFQLYHHVYQRTGGVCGKKNPRQGGASCKGIIQRIVVNSRSAHFCDTHQR